MFAHGWSAARSSESPELGLARGAESASTAGATDRAIAHQCAEADVTAAPVRPGDLLAGKYLVDRILGQGGMGVVVAARHVELDERVAIKFLLPEFASHAEVVARFLREGRASVKIRSEHVARVSDVGRLDSGSPYLVMEYLDGCDLADLLKKRGPLPIEETVLYLLQACEALAEAHALGIIHRDLKPPNLFLTHRADGSPCVKVLDFGIAKFSRDVVNGLTNAGGMMGSALYMSPEQLKSAKDVDVRADVWSLGVILFELLTNEQPFRADEIGPLVVQILHAPPTSLRSRRPDAPESLELVIQCCLAKEREQRFTTIAAFAAALLPFAGRLGRSSVERISRILKIDLGAGPVSSSATPRTSGPAAMTAVPPTESFHPTRVAPARIAVAATSSLASTSVQTDGSWGGTQPTGDAPIPGRRNRVLILAVTLAVTLVAIVAVLAIRIGSSDEHATPAAQGPKPTGAKVADDESPAAHPTAAAPLPTPTQATALPAASVVPAPSGAGSQPLPRPAGKLATPSKGKGDAAVDTVIPPAPPPPSDSCNPGYYYDSANHKHYLPGCQ